MLPSCVREFLYQMENSGYGKIDHIGPVQIQEHYQYLLERPNQRRSGGLSSIMIGHHLFSIRTFFVWLERLEAIEINPMAGLDFPRPVGKKSIALKREQIQALFEVCAEPRDKALLGVFYGCGLRRQEGVDLDVKDVDLFNATLVVRSGKYSKRREIPLQKNTLKIFSDYILNYRPELLKKGNEREKAFLLNENGKRVLGNTANRRIHLLARKIGLTETINLHRLRHSIATHLMDNGMPMMLIQQFLGHGSLDVTQAYIEGHRLHWNKQHYQ